MIFKIIVLILFECSHTILTGGWFLSSRQTMVRTVLDFSHSNEQCEKEINCEIREIERKGER